MKICKMYLLYIYFGKGFERFEEVHKDFLDFLHIKHKRFFWEKRKDCNAVVEWWLSGLSFKMFDKLVKVKYHNRSTWPLTILQISSQKSYFRVLNFVFPYRQKYIQKIATGFDLQFRIGNVENTQNNHYKTPEKSRTCTHFFVSFLEACKVHFLD